ncbi:CHAT domain-containing protein [Dactylosporangium aurantiacum]|uniref:CHAT domain-containing protein n=1 Tax=Dactylosporangium aurantiacum TaxID=35754 RepID=A0A9Q9I7Q9_9ACTN|nr:CHAT domain-containing protein [Dactylosporangium aurantiacum]MDG6106954.1 CHAT domain-containing protein [Dactylosporangium aurantiacum]UWZ50686.1 CHAT domain-containing protein [Dactylosporangium aurantiacum]
MNTGDPLMALDELLDRFSTGQAGGEILGSAEATAHADSLAPRAGELEVAYSLALLHHYRVIAELPADHGRDDAMLALRHFATVFRQAPDLVPDGVRDVVSQVSAVTQQDVGEWHQRAQRLLRDERRFAQPDLYLDARLLLQLVLERLTGDPARRLVCLTQLAMANIGWFEATGDLDALDGAIDAARDCVTTTPAGDPRLPGRRSNLASALATRFDHTGTVDDLDAAVDLLWLAVEESDPRERPGHLANLAGALFLRSLHRGDAHSLTAAVDAAWAAVDSAAAGDPDRHKLLAALARAARTRFQRYGALADADTAVEALREAAAAVDPAHPDHAGHQSALSTALRVRAGGVDRGAAAADLDSAVAAARAATASAGGGAGRRARHLSNLAAALSARSRARDDPADLDAAVRAGEEAAALVDPAEPGSAAILANLGLVHRRRAASGGVADLRAAADAYARSGQVTTAPALVRTLSLTDAGECYAEAGEWPAALHQFRLAIDALGGVIDVRLHRDDRQRHLSQLTGLGSEAAAAALESGAAPAEALALVEAGRGLLYAQTLTNRADLARLHALRPDLAGSLTTLLRLLGGLDEQARAEPDPRLFHQRERERDRLLDVVRALPGFADFLEIRPASRPSLPGPAVVINVARHRCDALVVIGDEVSHAELPQLSYATARDDANRLLRAVSEPDWSTAGELRAVLADLWDRVALPVLDHLEARGWAAADRHVWWIPTGPLTVVPLHAAGRDDGTDTSVMARTVSSYAPTVRALAHAAERMRTATPVTAGTSLVVAVPDPVGHRPLPETSAEAADVVRRLEEAGETSVTTYLGAAATRADVLAALAGSRWAHFACHGASEQNPADSHLVLHEEVLTVRDLAELDLRQADLAYLSACTTAFGGADLIDEAVHISSAFQLAGFTHAIGTLWRIGDADARLITAEIYAELLDRRPVAVGVHTALARLRQRYPDNPLLWAGHVHVGP